jgi:hypothetical protein
MLQNQTAQLQKCHWWETYQWQHQELVLLGSNKNRVRSTGRGMCSYSGLIGTSLGPLNTLIPSSRSLEIVGELNHLTLWGREFLSSCLWPWLKLRLGRTEHRSSWRRSNTGPRATARLILTHQLTLELHHSSVIFLAQWPCSLSLKNSQSLKDPKHRPAHHSGHLRNTHVSYHQC